MSRGQEVSDAYLAKARAELDELVARGVCMAGNAFSSALLVKGEPEEGELPDRLLAGADGGALRAALSALGYEPQDWAGLATVDADGAPLPAGLVRLAVTTLDAECVVLCDEGAARAMREAYADELSVLDDLSQAMLADGVVVPLLGMRVMALGGFAAALADPRRKQVMWARLKLLRPATEPY